MMNLFRMRNNSKNAGFTLIELLVVVGILAFLVAIIFVALDPITRFADARNSRRRIDVNSLLTAVHEYIVDNGGALPPGVSTSQQQLGTCSSGGNNPCTGASTTCLDLSSVLAKYLKSVPTDPSAGTAAQTKYSIVINTYNAVTIRACAAENGQVIEASR